MSIITRKNFSYPPKVFLSETLYFELPKNLVICFKGTLASLLLDTTKTSHSCLLLLNLKQRISPQLLKLQISESHLNPPKAICKHPKPSTAIQKSQNIINMIVCKIFFYFLYLYQLPLLLKTVIFWLEFTLSS